MQLSRGIGVGLRLIARAKKKPRNSRYGAFLLQQFTLAYASLNLEVLQQTNTVFVGIVGSTSVSTVAQVQVGQLAKVVL